MRTYSVEKAREEGGRLENARRLRHNRNQHLQQQQHGIGATVTGEGEATSDGNDAVDASNDGGVDAGGVLDGEVEDLDPDSPFGVPTIGYLPDPELIIEDDPNDVLPKSTTDDTPLPPDQDLQTLGEELGIRYFLVSYAPLNTGARVAVVPRRAIRAVQRHGAGVPAAMFFHADGADPEMYVLPDPASLIQLPWKPEYGWLASNLYMRGRPFSQCSRTALRKQIKAAAKLGYCLKAGVEPEFLLLDKEGKELGDIRDSQQPMSLQEPLAVMRTAPVMQRILDYMEQLGWEPYEVDHEASCCQYEFNFNYVDALTMADRYCFMKFMIKEVCEQEGYQATFMPVPVPKLLCANGLHVNVSLWHVDTDTNAFPGPESGPGEGLGSGGHKELGLSATASHFIGGLLHHAQASAAVMCPTINSYKRLNMGSWCPTTVCWGGNNRTVLIRVPAASRLEHRLPDGATNLYLSLAVILASGLHGVRSKIDPGPAIDTLVNQHPLYKKLRKMPQNLLDALRALKRDGYMVEALGPDLVHGFTALKEREWDQFMATITDWERHYYLNC